MDQPSRLSRRRLLEAGAAASLAVGVFPRGTALAAPSVSPTSPPLFVRKWGSLGTGNGQFNQPFGVSLDLAGDVYVADVANNRVQKFSGTGAYVTQWGSLGTAPGQFDFDHGLVVDGTRGFVDVLDTVNARVQKFDLDGTFLLTWGSKGKGVGQLNNPTSAALDANGNLYVADSTNARMQVFDGNGNVLFLFGSKGSGDGQFIQPIGPAIATLPSGTAQLYVADFNANRIQAFDLSGTYLYQWGALGSGNGQFNQPTSIGVDPVNDFLYVVDQKNNRVQRFDLSGNYLTTWSTFLTSTGGSKGAFRSPGGVTVSASGTIYVSDTGNSRIVEFKPR